jgi:hypothetical protein
VGRNWEMDRYKERRKCIYKKKKKGQKGAKHIIYKVFVEFNNKLLEGRLNQKGICL